MDLGLAEKVALVTGAGSGIGAVIAKRLVEHGCTVYVADSNLSAATDTVEQFNGRGHAITLDVSNASRAHQVVEEIVRERGRLDIVVNNAGILKTGSVADASIEDWDEVCRVNLSGVYYCCKAALPTMMARRYGKIINIASVSAVKGGGVFGNVLYGTTKAGVVALTKGLARELGPFGINVNAVAPGVTETGMTKCAADTGTTRCGVVCDSARQIRIYRRHRRRRCPACVRRAWLCHGRNNHTRRRLSDALTFTSRESVRQQSDRDPEQNRPFKR